VNANLSLQHHRPVQYQSEAKFASVETQTSSQHRSVWNQTLSFEPIASATQKAQLLANQAKLSLLTSNSEGAARPIEVIVSCTEMILKKTDLHRDVVKHAVGLELFQAACCGDACKTQTLLSTSNVQSYINYTDVKGRTSLYKVTCVTHLRT
jgi:hypothetical protein